MPQTAHVISENGETLILLPEGVELTAAEFDILQDERSGQITLLPHRSQERRSLETFFKLRDEVGPVEEDFIAYRDRKKLIYAEAAKQAAKPDTLDRFFAIQREVGAGEDEFLADRDSLPSQPRDVF